MVPIQTGGGVKAQLAADTTLMLGGVQHRLLAAESHYFQLADGRIVDDVTDPTPELVLDRMKDLRR